tara:strand:- start:63299 stop:63637 length:339 start_codon:yes stop_codon:yes gene_type:complete
MEENNRQLKSIWGKWWEPIRKWFYPAWLGYETSIRFYDYSLSVHQYFIKQKDDIASYIGETGTQALDMLSSVGTFIVCTLFLTVPACFVLYKFFKIENLTSSPFESKLKPIF